ncbi:uncharacterized protein SPSK_07391 [Sporothrix schenckii 1099-18]|uniref:Uncharacterized protein n=1 Tax=Sporothrix schenckii 1099-18 TaxID=1397361 RepID=A0A0F2MG94_SPOSC|nr:uncharacterized protein SPSK_07391 [Sporothrix schenckii 1099-18]KJR87875.1 hypothetical protein SPSK_07391 [Sporothrix schenckii 1099-18]
MSGSANIVWLSTKNFEFPVRILFLYHHRGLSLLGRVVVLVRLLRFLFQLRLGLLLQLDRALGQRLCRHRPQDRLHHPPWPLAAPDRCRRRVGVVDNFWLDLGVCAGLVLRFECLVLTRQQRLANTLLEHGQNPLVASHVSLARAGKSVADVVVLADGVAQQVKQVGLDGDKVGRVEDFLGDGLRGRGTAIAIAIGVIVLLALLSCRLAVFSPLGTSAVRVALLRLLLLQPLDGIADNEQRLASRRCSLAQTIYVQDVEVAPHDGINAPATAPTAWTAAGPVFAARVGAGADDSGSGADTEGGGGGENSPGFDKRPSALITPSNPVAARQRSTSPCSNTLPLANNTVSLGRFSRRYRSIVQSAMPVMWPFCSRRRPCTVRMLAPAASTVRAYCSDASGVSRSRILAVTGTSRFSCKLWLFLQKSAVVALTSDALWAAQVQVDGITVGRYAPSSGQQGVGIVGTKLDKEGSVDGRVAIKKRAQAVVGAHTSAIGAVTTVLLFTGLVRSARCFAP